MSPQLDTLAVPLHAEPSIVGPVDELADNLASGYVLPWVQTQAGAGADRPARALFILQNVSIPGDRRVWNEVCALSDAGMELVVICPLGEGESSQAFERREGIEIHRYPQPRASGSASSYLREYAVAFWHIRRLAKRLSATRSFDVVQAANPPDFLLLAVRFLKRRGARLIFDHHDLSPELYADRFGRGLLHKLTLLLERTNFRLADLVISTNESYRRVAMGRGGKREDEVFVVRNGPVLSSFTPVAPDPRLRRGHRHLISYIGEMAPQDGVDHAVLALARLREQRDDWYAVLAGDGVSLGDLRDLVAKHNLEDHVEFSGWLQDLELRRLLCSSDVCLVPDPRTPLSDASTLVKIAEYMAMSRPMVSYDLTESRLTAGDAAVYARPNDHDDLALKISELLDDPQRRRRMGEIGRERVEREFSWEHSMENLLGAYQVALESLGAHSVR
jgi:glycosyltransferase involved in cell wall biosynthesis